MVDVRDGRGRSRTRAGVHLAHRGASAAGTAAAGPTGVALRLTRSGLARWRRQRATLPADTRQRKAALALSAGPRRRRWPWVLGALVLAGGAAAVISVARPTPPPPPAAHPPRVDDPTPVDHDPR